MNRRSRPIFLTALCWLLIALVPATRNGLVRAGKVPLTSESLMRNGEFEREAKRRFPRDRRIRLNALSALNSDLSPGLGVSESQRLINEARFPKLEAAAREWKGDPTAISLILRAYLNVLKTNNIEGMLSNPGGPGAPLEKRFAAMSPRADWDKFIALARRGQGLEPNNSFWDWMVIYGLYATRRDDEARAALKIAARKTDFNDHSRDIILNRLAVLRMVYGAPLSPRDQVQAWQVLNSPEYGKMRQTARWVMEGAIADRSAKRHSLALDAAFDLARLGRVMRRESHFLIGSLVATAIQGIAISRIVAPLPVAARAPAAPRPPRYGAPLSAYRASPITLHAYAKSQNRADITRFLDREWIEIGRWRAMNKVVVSQNWTGNSQFQILALVAAERARILIFRALPMVLILGTLFTLLSKRFRDNSGAIVSGFWRGAIAGAVLIALAMMADATIILQNPSDDYWIWPDTYLTTRGLLSILPSWVSVGFASVAVLLALSAATRWQKQRFGNIVSLKTRLKTVFDAPEDGLMRFDFGWIFGLVVRGTAWALVLLAFGNLCFNHEWILRTSGLAVSTLGVFLMNGVLLLSLALHYGTWRTKPRRRATIRLGLRLISQSLLGFFVALSVIYAFIAFAMLPLAFRYDRNYQNAMERGEVQIARAKLGL